jgi:hypothetical protein
MSEPPIDNNETVVATPKFVPGDRVLVNGSLVAEIHTYDEDSNVLVYTASVGGGTDTTYAHISQTRLEHLIQAPVGSDTRPEAGAGAHEAGDDSE